MAGYHGNDMQQRLQEQSEKAVDFIRETPGACQNCRMIGCDQPELLGWDRIFAFLERDGMCGFRLLSPELAADVRSRLGERDFRLDTWDVFLAGRAEALSASQAIVAAGLPEGLAVLDPPTDPVGNATKRLQSLIGDAGIVPFSGSFLVGECGPVVTVVIGDSAGNPVAAAHGYMPHNSHSPFVHHAWGGLVAVAESARGKGLGRYVNALMVTRVFQTLGATHIYEMVSASNAASRNMVMACGLRHATDLVAGAAAPMQAARYTR